MNSLPWLAAFFILGYFIGAIPFGYIVGKLKEGVDIRDYGSGKIGMANVLRNLGILPAIIVLILDAGKGYIAVLLSGMFSAVHNMLPVAAALGVLVGHCFPIYIGFRGGRGLASFLGAFLAFSPLVTIAGGAIAILVMVFSRFVSLGSLTFVLIAAVMSGLLTYFNDLPSVVFIYSLIGGAFIFFQHRDNISRLLSGSERRIRFGKGVKAG